MTDRIERCEVCGDWKWEGWCWTCWHVNRNRADRFIRNNEHMARMREAA